MKKILLALAAGAALAGCSTTSQKAPENYPQLTVKADEANTFVFAKQNLKLGQYAKAYIAPVLVQVGNDQGVKDVTDDEAYKLAAYTQQRLKEAMAKHFLIVGSPGNGVLTVRFQIMDMQPTSKAQMAMMLPPFAMINMVSPKGVFMGSITLAGELYEGLAKEASVAFVATRSRPGIDASVAFSRWAVAEKVVDNAAVRLAEDLANERSAGN
jgi:hypothetical protein